MIQWIVYSPISLFFYIVALVINPILPLFADIRGELPGTLGRLFQTWDNSLDCSDTVDILPSWLMKYWSKHYVEHKDTTPELERVGQSRWFVECINTDFTIWERICRYIARTYWLYRNASYGVNFWYLGEISPAGHLVDKGHVTVDERLGLSGVFAYKNSDLILKLWKLSINWNIYIGWKLADKECLCMYACRPISFKVKWG